MLVYRKNRVGEMVNLGRLLREEKEQHNEMTAGFHCSPKLLMEQFNLNSSGVMSVLLTFTFSH